MSILSIDCIPTNETASNMEALSPIVTPARPSRWKRVFRSFWMRLCLLVLIFTAGGVAGWSMGSVWTQRRLEEIMKHPRPGAESLSQHLKISLELTEEQYADVQNIIRRHHADLEKIRQQVAPLYVGVFDEMDQEMQAVLETDAQREAWKKRAARMRDFWANGWHSGRDRDRGKRGDSDQRAREQKAEKSRDQ